MNLLKRWLKLDPEYRSVKFTLVEFGWEVNITYRYHGSQRYASPYVGKTAGAAFCTAIECENQAKGLDKKPAR